jgi:hypothetical protein
MGFMGTTKKKAPGGALLISNYLITLDFNVNVIAWCPTT